MQKILIFKEIIMKLSIGSGSALDYEGADRSPLDILNVCRDIGFKCMDFGISAQMVSENRDATAEKWKNLFEEAGIAVTQTHAPVMNPFNVTKTGEPNSDYLIGAIYFCQKAGFPHTVIHPGSYANNTQEEFFENNVKFFKSLIPHIEETGVGVLVENIGHYMDPYFLWSGKALRELIDAIDHPLITACWDIGHANHFEYMHGGNQYDSIVALGDKLTAIHAHDNVGFFADTNRKKRVDMHMMPFASHWCSVNWDSVIQALIDINYKGTFNFETPVVNTSRGRSEFVYNGEVVHKLEAPSFEIWRAANVTLHEIGKFMLGSYGVYEE